jgi:hypothetical protein
MRTESDFARIFPSPKSGTKESGTPIRWLSTDGHFEEEFRRLNIAESHPLLLFRNV